ncbi:MAG: hypothetical protein RLZZ480_108 [Candidatus Parcubacteria bacterium]|jgi:hypothetical protein
MNTPRFEYSRKVIGERIGEQSALLLLDISYTLQ